MSYYILLSFHIIFLFVWISSLFYLYKLAYRKVIKKDNVFLKEEIFVYKSIASPALLLAIICGICLIVMNKALLETGLWIYIKFFLISLIILIHFNYKLNLNLIEKGLKIENKKVTLYHIYSIFIMLFFVILLTKTMLF